MYKIQKRNKQLGIKSTGVMIGIEVTVMKKNIMGRIMMNIMTNNIEEIESMSKTIKGIIIEIEIETDIIDKEIMKMKEIEIKTEIEIGTEKEIEIDIAKMIIIKMTWISQNKMINMRKD
jgi:hypothetical protein